MKWMQYAQAYSSPRDAYEYYWVSDAKAELFLNVGYKLYYRNGKIVDGGPFATQLTLYARRKA